MEKEAASRKKKFHESLNPTVLNERKKNEKRGCKSKNKNNQLKPKPDGLKPKAIKWKKKLQGEEAKRASKA